MDELGRMLRCKTYTLVEYFLGNVHHWTRGFSIDKIDMSLASIFEGIAMVYNNLDDSTAYQIHHFATDKFELLAVSNEMVKVRALKV